MYNPDRGLNPGPTDIIADADVEVCCATTALPGHLGHGDVHNNIAARDPPVQRRILTPCPSRTRSGESSMPIASLVEVQKISGRPATDL